MTRKLEFIFGNKATTFTPNDIEMIWKEWEEANPGKIASRDMPGNEFANACMKRLIGNLRPARTVLHN